MIKIGTDEIKRAYTGETEVQAIYSGEHKVYEKAYLRVDPGYIWLMPENDNRADVDIFSNVVWETL